VQDRTKDTTGDIRFIRLFAEVPVGLWQFSAFSLAIFSDTLEMRPALF